MVGEIGHYNRIDAEEEQNMGMQKKKKNFYKYKKRVSGQVEIGLTPSKRKEK